MNEVSPAEHGTQGDAEARRTRFSDVCGTIDDLERIVREEPEAVVIRPEALDALVDDALFMLARMEPRLREYEQFRAEIAGITAALQELGDSRRKEAEAAAPALWALIQRRQVLTEEDRADVVACAEAIRAVAQDLENKLYRYKDLALALARAYRAIKGDRSWVLDEREVQAAALLPGEPEWARWLPPSPHRERILRYLRVGRAHLLPTQDKDQPPLLQFEDGGVMPLTWVRWSEEVRNFYLAESAPQALSAVGSDQPKAGESA
jgi:hypothetical protein